MQCMNLRIRLALGLIPRCEPSAARGLGERDALAGGRATQCQQYAPAAARLSVEVIMSVAARAGPPPGPAPRAAEARAAVLGLLMIAWSPPPGGVLVSRHDTHTVISIGPEMMVSGTTAAAASVSALLKTEVR